MTALTGQAFISSDIDCGIWLTGLVQEPMEIGIVLQTGIVNLMWGGVQRGISRIKILCRDGFEINKLRDIYGIRNFDATPAPKASIKTRIPIPIGTALTFFTLLILLTGNYLQTECRRAADS